MSYLNTPTIIFTGDFRSDVSTVNNDVRHYDVKTFEPRFQEPENGSVENGWWNPMGGANFDFVDCKVRRAFARDHSSTDSIIVGGSVTGPQDRSSGKMVDLDPQMQMTSELWGLNLAFCDPQGRVLFEGALRATGFRDLMVRQIPPVGSDESYRRNGQPLGATWYSVLEDIQWAPESAADPFLADLRVSSEGDSLAVSLSSFGYHYTHVDGRFSMGRILGVIGPRKGQEPVRFAESRRIYGIVPFRPFSFGNFVVETDHVTVDLGMSYPIEDPMGTPHRSYPGVIIAVTTGDAIEISPANPLPFIAPSEFTVIGEVGPMGDTDWLTNTGGIVSLPLTPEVKQRLDSRQLLLLMKENEDYRLLGGEQADGWYIRADENVQRLDPGDTVELRLHVTQWGRPVGGATVDLSLQERQSGGGIGDEEAPNPPTASVPDINFPASALSISAPAKTDANGTTVVRLGGTDPGNPREYVDGQIYLIDYAINGIANVNRYLYDSVIVHLRNAFEIPETPTWADVRETWVQFANLYPIMSRHIVDMTLEEALLMRRQILIFALTRDMRDPGYMPVTRDMSRNKMATLVKWLEMAPMPATSQAATGLVVPVQLPRDHKHEPTAPTPGELIARAKAGNPEAIEFLAKEHGTPWIPSTSEQ